MADLFLGSQQCANLDGYRRSMAELVERGIQHLNLNEVEICQSHTQATPPLVNKHLFRGLGMKLDIGVLVGLFFCGIMVDFLFQTHMGTLLSNLFDILIKYKVIRHSNMQLTR